MKKTAIIIGATGLTGGLLLEKLIADSRYNSIKVFSRKSSELSSSKVTEIIGNIIELEKFKADFIADEVYCCIGTTAKQTPDKQKYREIDFGIPSAAAKLCNENKINTFLVISALGSNAKSSIFYNRTKGEMEQAILNENIVNTYILKPSLITGKRKNTRLGEKIGVVISRLINPLLIGKLKKYRSIKAEIIAEAMINLANSKPKIRNIESDEIYRLGTNANKLNL